MIVKVYCDGILINIRVLRLFFEECKKTKNLDIGAILRGCYNKGGDLSGF